MSLRAVGGRGELTVVVVGVDSDHLVKIVIRGPAATGKTAMLQVFTVSRACGMLLSSYARKASVAMTVCVPLCREASFPQATVRPSELTSYAQPAVAVLWLAHSVRVWCSQRITTVDIDGKRVKLQLVCARWGGADGVSHRV